MLKFKCGVYAFGFEFKINLYLINLFDVFED